MWVCHQARSLPFTSRRSRPTGDPKLAEIARDLVKSIKADLTADWAGRESAHAAIRSRSSG
jgi:hypothetical protein